MHQSLVYFFEIPIVKWERAFADVYRRCTRRHSITKAFLLGIWITLQAYYLLWASEWDQWTRWSDADIVFSNVTSSRYIMFKNCTKFVWNVEKILVSVEYLSTLYH